MEKAEQKTDKYQPNVYNPEDLIAKVYKAGAERGKDRAYIDKWIADCQGGRKIQELTQKELLDAITMLEKKKAG